MPESQILQHAKSFSQELGWAVEAAAAAGQVIKDGVGKLHQIDKKGIGDLVSSVDRMADEAIKKVLQEHDDTFILSEELNPEVGESDTLWIVDPLDGTSAYLMQVGDHYPAVLIARYSQGQTQLGVAYFPLTEEWFYAQRGCCAWKNGNRLNNALAEQPNLSTSWVEMNQFGDASLETREFAALRDGLRSHGGASLVTTTVPNSGVALRIAEAKTGLVAAIHDNRSDHVKQAAWDVAAVQLILEEAGGVFVNLDGRSIDPFRPEVMVVARTPEIAGQIIGLANSLNSA